MVITVYFYMFLIDLYNLLIFLKEKLMKTIIIVSHDLTFAVSFSDSIILMNEGKIVDNGDFSSLSENGSIKNVFEVDIDYIEKNMKKYFYFGTVSKL